MLLENFRGSEMLTLTNPNKVAAVYVSESGLYGKPPSPAVAPPTTDKFGKEIQLTKYAIEERRQVAHRGSHRS